MTTKRWSVVAAVGLSLFAACDESGTDAAATPPRGADAGAGAAAAAIDDAVDDAVDDADDEAEATGDEEAVGSGDFAEPGGHFTVAFPSEPTVEERTTRSAYGTVKLKTFTAANGDARMVVTMGAVALKGRRLDVGRLIAQVRDENLAAFKIARKEEHAFETSGLPAMSVSYLGASGSIEVRGVMHIIVRRDPLTIYVAHAIAPPATDEVSLRLFVESFEPAATVSRMDEVLARTSRGAAQADGRARAAELAEAARREAELRAEGDRPEPLGGTASYRWSSVRTNGPRACVFFAGPVSRAARRSYTGGSGTWTLSGMRARFELGSAVDFSGTVRNGKVSVRNVERATLDGAPYTFTEAITGKLDATGRFRGTYRYSDCRTDGTERCPGPCTIRATLTGSP
jgi:hypothetical protein